MITYWMPYVQLHVRNSSQRHICIAKAAFWPDDDQTWLEVLKSERQKWIEIFLDFQENSREEGRPLRGTVVVSKDDEWLRKNIHWVIPVLYFLGDPASNEGPAEQFKFIRIPMPALTHDVVPMGTKKGPLIEDARSICLYPPWELRGHLGRAYKVNLHKQEHGLLTEILAKNPNDRLITACMHFFRAQFADEHASPWESDYASYSACLEAALNIEPRTREIGSQLASRLQEIHGESDRLREWIRGLYVCRSIHVHGSSSAGSDPERDQGAKAYKEFLERRGNSTMLHALCKDTILRQLRVRATLESAPLTSRAGMLSQFFYSPDRWQKLKKRLRAGQAAEKLVNLRPDELETFRAEVAAEFKWYFVPEVSAKDVRQCISTIALAVAKITKGRGPEFQACDSLGQIVDSNLQEDEYKQSIGAWARDHDDWASAFQAGDLLSCLRTCAYVLASFYDRW